MYAVSALFGIMTPSLASEEEQQIRRIAERFCQEEERFESELEQFSSLIPKRTS